MAFLSLGCFLSFGGIASADQEEPEALEADGEETLEADGGDVFEMGEVVVTSEKLTSSLVNTETTITREEFQMRGVNNVAEALRYIPGGKVSFSRGSLAGNGKNEDLVRLRGFETTDVMILIDGMPMTEPYMKRVDLSQILLDNVAKIKVIKGPSSVLYGPNTAGGIVNIISQKGEGFSTFLDQRFGDYMNFRTIAQNQGAVDPVNYVIGGSYDTSDGFPISRDFEGAPNQHGPLRTNSDFALYNVSGRVGSELGSHGNVSIGGSYYSFRGGVPYSMSAFDPTLWRKDWDRWYINGLTEWAITDKIGIKGQGFYNRFDNRIISYTDTTFQHIDSDGKGVSTHENQIYGYFLNPWWDLGWASFLQAGIRSGRRM